MTLSQIQYFRVVAQTGNITSAADQLYVSRPAISRSIRDLEKEFGIAFFQRSNTGLALTEAGCIFYAACNDIQDRLDKLEEQIAEKKALNRCREIRLGLTPLTGITIFPQFYREFHAAHPEIKIITMEYSHSQARLMLEDGSMDASFTTYTEGLAETVDCMMLTQTHLVFCVASSHPLATRTQLSVGDICSEPLVYLGNGMQREREVLKAYRQIGKEPNVVLRVEQLNTLRTIVAEGIAATIQLHGSIDDGQSIIGIPFSPAFPFKTSLIWNRLASSRKEIASLLSFASQWRARNYASPPTSSHL